MSIAARAHNSCEAAEIVIVTATAAHTNSPTCRGSLNKGKIPQPSRSNGFAYPQKPAHLPPLNAISKRLTGIVGQVVNIPVEADEIVECFPRNVSDDADIFVNLSKIMTLKSVHVSGMELAHAQEAKTTQELDEACIDDPGQPNHLVKLQQLPFLRDETRYFDISPAFGSLLPSGTATRRQTVPRSCLKTKAFSANACDQTAFVRGMPNFVYYWAQRKGDVFPTIRQLGKPTLFLTLSMSELHEECLLTIIEILKEHGEEHRHTLDTNLLMLERCQIHLHHFTCYKRHTPKKVCRSRATFRPMSETRVITPTLKHDGNVIELELLHANFHNVY
ncbi:hypothetical protein HPB49_016302 [Dermacentor silvarum]|uniref:Uncharacterized protein n=1 Tax=Dermacentor silvarum TaxID=543639 RepID=A0ACB8CG92_DERSI|nr:hypothetical protein HPB49_016302 [Dermacentor silvarum]